MNYDLETQYYDNILKTPKVYSEAEIERLRQDKSALTQELVYSLLDYLDSNLKFDRVVENGQGSYWTLKKTDQLGAQTQVILDVKKLKLSNQKDLFFSQTQLWLTCFYLHWWLKYKTYCNITFLDKTGVKRSLLTLSKKDIGKYVSFYGRLKRISGINVAIVSTYYNCVSCKQILIKDRLWYEKIKEVRCNCGTKNANSLVQKEAFRRYETWQSLTLQNIVEQESDETSCGGSTASIECRVLDPIDFNKYMPGQLIKIKGILRTETTEKAKAKLYVDLYGLEPVLEKPRGGLAGKKLDQIKALKTNTIWEDLKYSLFPGIVGLDVVKESALLQYLGGGGTTQRKSIHVLVSGDPGVGKSQILKAIQKSFGGIYTTGLGSSVAGLTASVYKDTENQWNIDGGSAVLANNSVLLLDEADKMSLTVANSLLEPMEQQTVSVAKAGLTVNLPARLSVFAVSNPRCNQKFDATNQLSYRDQLGFAAPFMSRFDLIFFITEKSQMEIQNLMAEKVLEPESRKEVNEDYVNYLRYAKTIHPQMPKSIKSELTEFYLHLKKVYDKYIPLGPRNLEALARLVEAKAKSRLSELVEAQDLDYVKQIYEKSLLSQLKAPPNTMNSVVTYKQLLELQLTNKEQIYSKDILDLIVSGLEEPSQIYIKLIELHPELTNHNFQKIASKLEQNGVIYKPKGKGYKIVSNK